MHYMKKLLPAVLVSILAFSSSYALSSAETTLFTPNAVTAQSADTLTIKHLSGETTVPKNPQKVVLFDFGVYDSMNTLGLGDKVVALPLGNAPAYLKDKLAKKIQDAGG